MLVQSIVVSKLCNGKEEYDEDGIWHEINKGSKGGWVALLMGDVIPLDAQCSAVGEVEVEEGTAPVGCR